MTMRPTTRPARAAAGRRRGAAGRHLRRDASCSSPAAAPASARRSPSEFARLGADDRDRQPQARAPRGRRARRSEALGARVRRPSPATSATPSRSPPRSTPPSRAFGLPDVLDQQRGRQLPGAGRGHVAQRVAHRRRHHAQRHVLLRPRVRPPPPRGRHARARSSTSARRTRGPAAPASRTPPRPRPGVKNMVETLAVEWGPYGIQVNGLVPGLFPHEDMTADIQGNLDRTRREGRVPAGAAGRAASASSAGRRRSSPRPTPGSSPATRSWSTARTGSAAASPTRRSSPSATRWARAPSSHERDHRIHRTHQTARVAEVRRPSTPTSSSGRASIEARPTGPTWPTCSPTMPSTSIRRGAGWRASTRSASSSTTSMQGLDDWTFPIEFTAIEGDDVVIKWTQRTPGHARRRDSLRAVWLVTPDLRR